MRPAEERSSETAGNAGSLSKRPLLSQKLPKLSWGFLSWVGHKAPGFGAACLCLSQKTTTSENREAGWHGLTEGWHGRATETQAENEAGRDEKQLDLRECWEPHKEVSSMPEAPRAAPDRVLCPSLWSGEPVSLTEDLQKRTRWQGGMHRQQSLMGTLRQSDGRSSRKAGNAGSLPRRPISSQKLPGLCWVCCNT